MNKELIKLTIILSVLISCNQTVNKENNKSIDSVTTNNNLITDNDLNSAKLELVNTELGLGLVSINFDDKTVLHFFSSPYEKEPIRTIQFFNDLTINSWNIRNLDEHRKWLKPEVLWLDYSSFVFRCLTVQENWLKVIVNNETGETLWLKKSELTTFKDWESYLKEMFGVKRLHDQPQKIRVLPADNAEEIIYQGQDCFQVKAMKEDWIEIVTAEYCDKSNNMKIKSGWIR